MADQNMVVFSYWLERQCYLLHEHDEGNKENGGPEHCHGDLNYCSKALPFSTKAVIN